MRTVIGARSRRFCKGRVAARGARLPLQSRAPCYTESSIEQDFFVGRCVIRRSYGL
ncbi:hypothetical protein [Microviridae sp.]|nr:hypothetical protein [Microviridae sp.]UOF81756.1 hypothetical protein [Microviridae sp.]